MSIELLQDNLKLERFVDVELFVKIQQSIRDHFKKYSSDCSFPIKLPALVSYLRELLPRDSIVVLDNGLYKVWFARNYPAYKPDNVLLDNTLATMGAGLPSAIAAAILNSDKKVVAVCGDGGFMMNSAELETAVRLDLDLVILLLQDNGLGMIKWKQEEMGLKDYSLDLKNPNFIDYAKSYGAYGASANSIEDLKQLIMNGFNTGGVHLIELKVDYSKDNYILNTELKELSDKLKLSNKDEK